MICDFVECERKESVFYLGVWVGILGGSRDFLFLGFRGRRFWVDGVVRVELYRVL